MGDFNIPLTELDRSSRQKTDKETLDLNLTLDQIDLTQIYRIFYPATVEYTFFSPAYGTYPRFSDRLGHKADINTFLKNHTEYTPRLQCNKNKNKYQEDLSKLHKHMEIEQLTPE